MNLVLFWASAAALAVVSALAVAWPLLRPRVGRDPREHALAVYKDQLDEIDRDQGRGLIDEEQARAARIEIQRRILHTARETEGRVGALRSRPVAAAVVCLAVGVGSLGVYTVIGEPGLPGQPLSERDQGALREERERLAVQLANLEEQVAAGTAPQAAEFWFALGRLRLELVGPTDAARAFREGLARNADSVLLMAALGETLVQLAEGTVTPAAKELFTTVTRSDPNQPQALYFLGMGAAQAGDDTTALDHWGRLLATGPSDASWRDAVVTQYREIADRAGLDADALLAERPGAGPEGAAMAADLEEAEREAMIRSMVDGLAARLEADPSDVDGWMRLGRSRLVLGETEGAVEAYARARTLAPGNADALTGEAEARLAAAERVQGVPLVDDTLSRLLIELADLQPENPQPHWYLGLHAVQRGDFGEARMAWERVLALLGPDNPSYTAVKEQIDALPDGS